MQGIQVEPGISQFLRLWAKRIASTRRPTIIAVRSHSLRFMTPAFILKRGLLATSKLIACSSPREKLH
jgi:hypothetical protein